ncbi:unnamed protein product, partial [Leptidea sinapis]
MPRGENKPSILLTREENEQVFSLIGPKCLSLATSVVQLFTTEGPGHTEWKKKDTGVLCLIKDNSKRSYFFRIYCLYRRAMIWEHEVYMQIDYRSPRPYLHTFEAEEYMTALNFASEDEAMKLRNILIDKIETRKHRREGFDVENLDEAEMRSFLVKAGISEKQLADHATRQFIYDFINMNGVVTSPEDVMTQAYHITIFLVVLLSAKIEFCLEIV